jgi:3-oxoacyl-[acyl-carrier-protein] synthase III
MQGRITAVATYLPERVITNDELISRYDLPFSAQWLQRTTGVRERRIAGAAETTLSMAAAVVQKLIQAGRLRDPFVDVLILTSDGCAEGEPGLAALVASMVGLSPALTLDFCAACGGVAAALDAAHRQLERGSSSVLVVSSEVRSQRLRNASPEARDRGGSGGCPAGLAGHARAANDLGRSPRGRCPLFLSDSFKRGDGLGLSAMLGDGAAGMLLERQAGLDLSATLGDGAAGMLLERCDRPDESEGARSGEAAPYRAPAGPRTDIAPQPERR